MFFVLLLCQFALTAANPFHKYPYVFLLDIGNEELEKTNTEQIRLSLPGGSLALRYPAIGNGDTIAHVRVSGIDFGTDLKANIVDGGPGYKYVVVVFMGNPGVPYDAVVTIQTVSDSDVANINQSNTNNLSNSIVNDSKDNNDSAEVTDDDEMNKKNVNTYSIDANDSSEDTSDDTESQNAENGNTEISQGSSNIYSYAKNDAEEMEDDNNDVGNENDSESDNLGNDKDIHRQYSEARQEVEVKDYQKYSDMNYEYNSNEDTPEQSVSSVYTNEENDDKPARLIDNNIYSSYSMLRPALFGLRFYPQNAVPFMVRENGGSVYNSEEFDAMINDDDDHNEPEKLRDSNNNLLHSDDNSAVMS
ncbi:unnamed protein product [Diatraea saccharalis]|uniref:Uncharacterized protein n=1 Tax=Diatraea saccharalis TaxID=40085 RepID=A0A9N9R8C1_9NEOP|nr:unnamed protein product [Diatraea saccharalis]